MHSAWTSRQSELAGCPRVAGLALFIVLFVWAHFCNRFQINISNLGPHRTPSALSHTFALSRTLPGFSKCILRNRTDTSVSCWDRSLMYSYVWVYQHGSCVTVVLLLVTVECNLRSFINRNGRVDCESIIRASGEKLSMFFIICHCCAVFVVEKSQFWTVGVKNELIRK